jgi:hypothetical protein
MLPMLWYVRLLKGYTVEPPASTIAAAQTRTLEVAWAWQISRCISSANDSASSSAPFDRLLACVKIALQALYRLPFLLTRCVVCTRNELRFKLLTQLEARGRVSACQLFGCSCGCQDSGPASCWSVVQHFGIERARCSCPPCASGGWHPCGI